VTSRVNRRRSAGGATARVLAFVLLAGVALAVYLWLGRDETTSDSAESVQERKSPSVVMAIQSLARLESVSFHIEKVIDLKRTEQALWGLVEAEDSILLVAAGDVVAGVDLGKLRAGDITLTEEQNQVRIVLPPPEVFSARLDNEGTYVHKRDTDMLASGHRDLETDARRRAQAAIQQGAFNAGILDHARRNAEHTVRALAMSFGYNNVILEWRRE